MKDALDGLRNIALAIENAKEVAASTLTLAQKLRAIAYVRELEEKFLAERKKLVDTGKIKS